MKRLASAGAALLALFLTAATPSGGPVDGARLLDPVPAPTLDAYGLFKDAGAYTPNAGVTPYALNTPLFSDYAEKFRFVYLPPGTKAAYRDKGVLEFPVGATLVKTFAYPADFRRPTEAVRKIETRLLIRRADGWTPLTYVWNAVGDQAVLKRAGARTPVSFTDAHGQAVALNYAVPNVNQCKECHAVSGVMTPIGPKANNLNGAFAYAEGPENQLAHWSVTGMLTGAPAPAAAPMLARWDDASAPVADRARAYLEVNCAHCHNRAALASNSGLYLEHDEADPVAAGVGKRPVAAGRGSGGLEFDIVPGKPDQSILIHRMASREPGVMMPELARSVPHEEGLAVVRAYIASMQPPRAR